MKMLSLFAAILVSVSVNAATTSVIHDYGAVLHGIELNNACITSTEVKTIKPVRACTKLVPVKKVGAGEGGDTYIDWVCEKWEKTQLSYSRAFERTVCVDFRTGEDFSGCVRTEVQKDFMPATIKVTTVTDSGEYSNFPGVQSKHTFPACK